MDGELRELLMLAGCGARGEAFHKGQNRETEEDLDYQHLLQRTVDLEVFPFCVRALQKNKELWESTENMEAWGGEIRRLAMGQAVGRERLFGLLKRLQKAGYTYAIMKGCAIAESYGEPFLRMSADTDILIEKNQEQELYRWLKNQGFTLEKREPQEYHGVVRHKEYGIIELHIALSDPRIMKYWRKKAGKDIFQAMQRPPVWIEGRQGSFYSLEYTEQMLFVTLHFIRHLFAMEGTLRMLLDNCMYASYYRGKIDWFSYWEALKNLGYEKLVKAMFLAADTYMGFTLTGEESIFPAGIEAVEKEDMEGLLEILCAVQENMNIADEFKDIYRSKEMNLGENIFLYRMKTLWGVALYTVKRTRKDGLASVLKRVPGKVKRILTGHDNRKRNVEAAEWMRKRRAVFGRLGLMRDEEDN